MRTLIISFSIFTAIFMLACSGSKRTTNTQLNPNGDTELALLMRAMYDDGESMKKDILAGKMPKGHVDISRLRIAEATEPDKLTSPEYQAYAQAYEAIYAQLNKTSETEQRVELYKSLVGSCTSCHKALCPGPLVRIEKLELE